MNPPFLPRQRLTRLAVAGLVLLTLATFAFLPRLSVPTPSLPGGCVFHRVTGLPCALCGGTRAARALLQGDVPRAWKLNPLALPAVAALLALGLVCAWEGLRGRPLLDWPRQGERLRTWAPFLLLALLLWWFPHLWGALRGSNSELLDLQNPIARTLHDGLRKPEK